MMLINYYMCHRDLPAAALCTGAVARGEQSRAAPTPPSLSPSSPAAPQPWARTLLTCTKWPQRAVPQQFHFPVPHSTLHVFHRISGSRRSAQRALSLSSPHHVPPSLGSARWCPIQHQAQPPHESSLWSAAGRPPLCLGHPAEAMAAMSGGRSQTNGKWMGLATSG